MFSAEVIKTFFSGELSSKMSLTSCFSISFWNFFAQMWYKNYALSDVKLHLFFVSVEKSESLFIDCSGDTDADEEHGVAQCNVRIWSSFLCWDSVFEVSASSVNCTRHIAINGSRAQLCVISSSSSILVALCFRRFWFRRYSRVTLTCYSFDVLSVSYLILFWYFRSLSHFFLWGEGGWGGITSKWISGITLKAIWCSFYSSFFAWSVFILSELLIYFLFPLGFFLNVILTKST